MSDSELLPELTRSERRKAEFRLRLEREMAAPDHEPFTGPFPVSLIITYHDGPGAQLLDANGLAIVPDLIRDEEQAVWLLRTLNGLAPQK